MLININIKSDLGNVCIADPFYLSEEYDLQSFSKMSKINSKGRCYFYPYENDEATNIQCCFDEEILPISKSLIIKKNKFEINIESGKLLICDLVDIVDKRNILSTGSIKGLEGSVFSVTPGKYSGIIYEFDSNEKVQKELKIKANPALLFMESIIGIITGIVIFTSAIVFPPVLAFIWWFFGIKFFLASLAILLTFELTFWLSIKVYTYKTKIFAQLKSIRKEIKSKYPDIIVSLKSGVGEHRVSVG